MKKAFIIIISLALMMSVQIPSLFAQDKNSGEADTSHRFLQATQAYKDGAFDQAAALYEKLLAQGIVNGSMFYNLGNAYLKAGKIGKALVNYRRAEMFMPRNEDLQANIQYTQQLTTDKIEGREPYAYAKNFCFWYSKLNVRELAILFLIFNLILWGLAIARLFYNWEYLWLALYVSIACAILLGISSGIKMYSFYYSPAGVVTAKEITVRSGGSRNDTALFQLHEGTEFDWLDESSGWVKIKLRDGKKGWAQKDTVEKVAVE
jgi:tetratricopeptide (TPR) repeat protein